MLKSDIRNLQAGDRLFVRHYDPHFKRSKLLDVDVRQNRIAETQVDIVVYYNGQAVPMILYHSGRTPYAYGYLATDFYREKPSRDEIGGYVYEPYRDKWAK